MGFYWKDSKNEISLRSNKIFNTGIGIADYQIEKLNGTWQEACKNVPYYRELRKSRNLPDVFRSLEEYQASMPLLTKAQFMANRLLFLREGMKPETYFITGGSTGEPVHIPAWNRERAGTNQAVGRSWYGIEPGDRLFLIWGHHHLLQQGLWPRLESLKRHCKDYLLGYKRFSAYNLSDQALKAAAEKLLPFRPHYLIGYSTALYLFALANASSRDAFRNLRLKAVIATAECFPHQKARAAVEEFFKAPLAMEYGSVEGGTIAYTHPSDDHYRVFWDTHLVEAHPIPAKPGLFKIYITKLTPSYTPLLRYDLGDSITLDEKKESRPFSVLQFDNVWGRSNDVIELADGGKIHIIAIDDVLEFDDNINIYQLVQSGPKIIINIVYRTNMTNTNRDRLLQSLARIHPDLGKAEIAQVEKIEQTMAGKAPRILRRD
jgi:phenylacetate-CoA ligase